MTKTRRRRGGDDKTNTRRRQDEHETKTGRKRDENKTKTRRDENKTNLRRGARISGRTRLFRIDLSVSLFLTYCWFGLQRGLRFHHCSIIVASIFDHRSCLCPWSFSRIWLWFLIGVGIGLGSIWVRLWHNNPCFEMIIVQCLFNVVSYYFLTETDRKWTPILLTATTHLQHLFRHCFLHWWLMDLGSILAPCWEQVGTILYDCWSQNCNHSMCLLIVVPQL